MPAQVLVPMTATTLTYTLVGADGVFEIDEDTGMITVGSAGISDSTGGPD